MIKYYPFYASKGFELKLDAIVVFKLDESSFLEVEEDGYYPNINANNIKDIIYIQDAINKETVIHNTFPIFKGELLDEKELVEYLFERYIG